MKLRFLGWFFVLLLTIVAIKPLAEAAWIKNQKAIISHAWHHQDWTIRKRLTFVLFFEKAIVRGAFGVPVRRSNQP
jgi:hypothetical protein